MKSLDCKAFCDVWRSIKLRAAVECLGLIGGEVGFLL